MSTRVALIHEIVSPYRAPLFATLASRRDLDLTVVLAAEREPRRSWHIELEKLPYPWVMVRSHRLAWGRVEKSTWFVPRGLGRTLRRLRPDVVVIGGYASLPALRALIWSRRCSVPVVMWSESIRPGRGGLVKQLKRAVVRQADAFIVPGGLAGRHLVALGADPESIFTAPNCIDLQQFRPSSTPVGGNRVVLACGRLVPNKGWFLLGAALAEADPGRSVRLLIVGEGPDRERLEKDFAARGISATFTGHVQYNDLRDVFVDADAVVFPSLGDAWGFSLQEAMACGLPAVASDKAGATPELVHDGVNGWVITPDSSSLAEALKKLLALSPEEWSAMGTAARQQAERLSVDAAVTGFQRAVTAARTSKKPKKP